MSTNQAIAQQAAQALEDTATSHKRAASYHRRQAREAMVSLARLREAAAAMGIKIITRKAKTQRHGQH